MNGPRTADKRMLAWLNEGAVLIALTKNQNRPTYVALIARMAPEFTRSGDESSQEPDEAAKSEKEEVRGVTKPGMREAAKRLHERGILARLDAVPPRKRTATPHYSINPSIKTLADISSSYGSWVVTELRRAGLSGQIIDGGMDGHLSGVLRVPLAEALRVPMALKQELAYLARASTKALEAFIDPGFELDAVGPEEASGQSTEARVARLKDVMHLAFISEVASSGGLRIWDEGWDVSVNVETTVRAGDITMRLKTDYDSKRFVRRPERGEEEAARQ
ncbi:MAG: hypothetical protein AB7S97_02030 [Thermoplasmata archaeon]